MPELAFRMSVSLRQQPPRFPRGGLLLLAKSKARTMPAPQRPFPEAVRFWDFVVLNHPPTSLNYLTLNFGSSNASSSYQDCLEDSQWSRLIVKTLASEACCGCGTPHTAHSRTDFRGHNHLIREEAQFRTNIIDDLSEGSS